MLVVTLVAIAIAVNALSPGPWVTVTSPTSADLFSVAMVSPTEGWAVGESGTILRYADGS
jgi:photosystem II stability/assembly factor-like uncharacterized protein